MYLYILGSVYFTCNSSQKNFLTQEKQNDAHVLSTSNT